MRDRADNVSAEMSRRWVITGLVLTLIAGTASPASAATEADLAWRSGIPTPQATIIRQPCPDTTTTVDTGLCTFPDQGVIYLGTDPVPAFMREHELGHLFELQYIDAGEQNAIKRALNIPASRPWITGTGLTADGLESPNELAADLYAACRLQIDPRREWDAAYFNRPSWRQYKTACGVLCRAGDDLATRPVPPGTAAYTRGGRTRRGCSDLAISCPRSRSCWRSKNS